MPEAYGSRYIEHPLIWPETVEYRLYRKRIADIAYERNTLVILPTALGKTVISAIVAARILCNYRDAKVLVMAPTRPLIEQHRRRFHEILKLREKDTVLLTGRTPPHKRSFIWDGEARIYFSTPQVVRNLYIERVEFRSEYDPDVKPYIHPIKVEWKRVNLPSEYFRVRSIIRNMLDKRLEWLYSRG